MDPNASQPASSESSTGDIPYRAEDADVVVAGNNDQSQRHQARELSLQELLDEAIGYYGDSKPYFVVANNGDILEKRMRLLDGSGRTPKMIWKPWLSKKTWGYWLLEDETGDGHIVKFFGKHYYIWRGLAAGLENDPVAVLMQSDKPQKRGARKRNADSVEKDNDANSTFQPGNDRARVKLSDDNAEQGSVVAGPSTTPHAALVGPQEHGTTLKSTYLRTRLEDFSGPSIPLQLSNITDSKELFRVLRGKWAFKLAAKQQTIVYCVAKFAWLGDDRAIYLQEADADAFGCLCEEVRRMPGWADGERADVAIAMHVE